MCIQFALMLSVLIALGPFLHAHYGASKVTGLHVAGVNSVFTTSMFELAMTSVDPGEEQESAALGVETSYARQVTIDVQDQPPLVLILTIFVVTLLIQRVTFFLRHPDTQRQGRPCFLAGFPPLLHAPPSFRC